MYCPPPRPGTSTSNRLWFGFTSLPKMEVDIEPVVSERKVQWSMLDGALLHFHRLEKVLFLLGSDFWRPDRRMATAEQEFEDYSRLFAEMLPVARRKGILWFQMVSGIV